MIDRVPPGSRRAAGGLALLWFVLGSACAGLPGMPLGPEQIFERSAPSIVRLQVRRPDGDAVGSGFVIAPGQIATNLHVIDGAQEAYIQSRDGLRYTVRRVLAMDDVLDLAILEIAAPDLRPLRLADSDALTEGERIYAIGNPFGLDYTITEGLFSGRRRIRDTPPVDVLQVSVSLSPGSSGGPLINARGEVIGVASRTIPNQPLGIGVPSNALRALRDRRVEAGVSFSEFRASRGVARPRPGQRVRNVPDHAVAFIAGCKPADLAIIASEVQRAIGKGAPAYNEGDPETCFRIYEGAALRLVRDLPAECAGGRSALQDGMDRASTIDNFDDKAWAMRDAFDGLLDVIDRRQDGSL
jgi:serine protease Do